MPRPKRTKIASTAVRVAKPLPLTRTPTATHQATRKADIIESFSDDSDGLVTKATRIRVKRRPQLELQSDADFTMTGALPASTSSAAKSRSKRRSSSRNGASSDNHTPQSVKADRLEQVKRGAITASSGSSPIETRSAVESRGFATEVDDSLSLDNLLSFGSLDSDSPAHGTRPPSAMKVGGTPAHESSILALTNFRRRPRQPSLLRMVHRTTDVEDNDLDDLEGFNPADESTPIHPRNRAFGEDENHENSGLSLSSVSSRGKKRKLSSPIIQVPRSSPIYDPPSGADVEDSHRSSSPSLPEEVIQSTEDAQAEPIQPDPEIFSETMAPPKSSSPVEAIDDPVEPEMSRQRNARKTRKTTRNEPHDSDDQSAAASKPRARGKVKTNSISTAKLQALLPRRRTHISVDRDVYDLEGSDNMSGPIDSDQDELQMPASRLAGRNRKSAAPKAKKGRKATRNVKQHSIVLEPTTKPTRTYGRRASSDKENESSLMLDEEVDDDDDVTDVAPKRAATITKPAPNLAAITQKFAEIDEWEMDFEDVDANGTSSSPWR